MAGFPERILFAADGSHESDLARERLVDLVGKTHAEVHVLYVGLVSPWTNPTQLGPQHQQRLTDEAQSVLDAQAQLLRDRGLHPQTHLRMGRATDEILRVRDQIDADLIVLGSRGLNAFTRVLLGNDAESVVRHAPCPVLVVRKDA